ALLTNLQEGDVLFIDEIHRLMPQLEEKLYPAMEDFSLDLLIGQGPGGAFDQVGSAKVYSGRGHDAGRIDYCTFARPVWNRLSFGFLSTRRFGNDLQTFSGHS